MNLLENKPSHHSFGLKDAQLVTPGAPQRSVLWHRVQTIGEGKMPPVGRNVTDPEGAKLVEEWIRSLPVQKAASAQTNPPR
jgi:hypothetical protein